MGLRVNRTVVLPEDELAVEAARSGGPGGQNVNKVATKVVLRFRPGTSSALSDAQRARVLERLAHRLTKEGELVLHASGHRLRSRNLEEARERLAGLLAEALRVRPPRKATRPTRASKRRRLDTKRRRGEVKRGRRGPPGAD
jgi:ribosome-associated protein